MNSGQVVTAPCSVIEGDHPLQLRWLFGGEAIKPRSGVTVFNIGERSAILSISSVAHNHAGNYTCIAENAAGVSSHTSILIINGENIKHNFLPLLILELFIFISFNSIIFMILLPIVILSK